MVSISYPEKCFIIVNMSKVLNRGEGQYHWMMESIHFKKRSIYKGRSRGSKKSVRRIRELERLQRDLRYRRWRNMGVLMSERERS